MVSLKSPPTEIDPMTWHAAHTKPRREKKLAAFCQREGLHSIVPLVKNLIRHGRKTLVFQKPLFPGYVFIRCEREKVQRVSQNEHTAKVLRIWDQQTFERQLSEILLALENDSFCVQPTPLCAGMKIRILSGPLQGIEGQVLETGARSRVVLNLDFIGQGAVVTLLQSEIEPI